MIFRFVLPIVAAVGAAVVGFIHSKRAAAQLKNGDSPTVIPLVRLGDPSAMEAIREAAFDHGFFFLVGHGIDTAPIFVQSNAFFKLPLPKKLAIQVSAESRGGYTPFADQTLDESGNQKGGDRKEGYYIVRPRTEHAVEAGDTKSPLHGNQWPDEADVPGWRDTMLTYFADMQQVGLNVTKLLSEALGLPRDYLDQFTEPPDPTMRLLHYPAWEADAAPEAGVYGAGAHTDWGMFTLLAVDGVPGLQIERGGQWIDVPSIPGAFVVNFGDMLRMWTNDNVQSTRHRVLVQPGRERSSIAYFFEPNLEAKIQCLPSFCKEPGEALYSETTPGEYLMSRLRATELWRQNLL